MPSRQHLDNKSSQESAALPLVLPILYCLVSRGKRSKGNMLPRVWRQGNEQVWPGANVNKRESLAPCWGEFRGSFLSHGTTSVVNSTGPYTEQRASEWHTGRIVRARSSLPLDWVARYHDTYPTQKPRYSHLICITVKLGYLFSYKCTLLQKKILKLCKCKLN